MSTHSSLEAIFFTALEKRSPAERAAYLDEACAGDNDLRQRVERMITAQAEAGSFLEVPAGEIDRTLDQPIAEKSGTIIGPYKLLQKIGEGGMGVVYMAEQTEPVERRVALKIIKPGMDTHQVIARFEAERQALAMMDHPNISKVFDAGATESGRPYFVMELVKGVPITQYCDDHQLSPRERLDLFIPVCQAVQHAHQKGIIHRDIKPSNVMVVEYDDRAVPKIIDFGVAKAIEQRLTEKTMFTQLGQMVGTIDYMSPEQAKLNQLDIDTRSDIYSLGVLLYELLTGETPLDRERLHSVAFDEMLRMIREEEPLKPSQRLSSSHALPSIAANRHIEPKKLSTLVRGELDWIVMKALEKDRTRRYETANGFSADIERYLKDEPVGACPPSLAYRISKFSRRNKTALLAVAAVMIALLLGFAGTAWQAVRATSESNQKEVARQVAVANEQKALVAVNEVKNQKAQVVRERDVSREILYFAHIRLAQEDWKAGNVSRMLNLLDMHRPGPGEPDLRGWEWYYLYSLTKRNVRTFYGHSGPVLCVAWSPDGGRVASGSTDGSIKIWDAATGEQVSILRGHAGAVFSVAWEPDGRRVASAAVDHSIKIWDLVSGNQLRQLQIDSARKYAVSWSPDGRWLASANGLSIRIWNTESWEIAFSSEAVPRGLVTSVAWSPDSKSLAWTHERGYVSVWEVGTQKEKLIRKWNYRGVYSIDWSPDGHRLALCNRYEAICLWSVNDTEDVPLELLGHTASVNALDWSRANSLLASASHDGTIRTWNTESGKELLTLRGHVGWVHDVCWGPDGRRLASAGDDGTLRIWEPTRQEALDLPGRSRVAWHPDGRRLATVRDDRHVIIVNVQSGQIERVFEEKFNNFVSALAWSSNGQRLAAASADGNTRVWDTASGTQLLALRSDKPSGETRGLCWSPNDRFIATCGWDCVVKVWDASSGKLAFCLEGHKAIIGSVVWSPDGQRIASASWDQVVKIWDIASHQELFHLLREEQPSPRSLAWGESHLSFGDAADAQYSVIWSHDSKRLYTGSGRGDISTWDMDTGQELLRFHAHPTTVRSLALSPNGRRLLSAGNDGTIKLWESSTGRELLTLHGGRHSHFVAWSPNGRQLASTCNSVRIWDATPGYKLEKHTVHKQRKAE